MNTHREINSPLIIIDRDTLFEPREKSVSVDQLYDSDFSEAILTDD